MNATLKSLIDAEAKALHLFNEIEEHGLIKPGITEKELNKDIYALAKNMYGISKYWHKRIVRTGKNTLQPYAQNPPDLIIAEDDILFLDFGPIFEDWEADFGRTYVLGSDPVKLKLKRDIEEAWQRGRDWYFSQSSVTGAGLYQYVDGLAREYGWTFGANMAGHLIGKFPHEKLNSVQKHNYIHPQNHQDMFAPDKSGQKREWILEIHFIDQEREIGGFFEQLLV